MPRTSLLHSCALPPAKVIGELEVRWCRSVVWLGQDSDSDSFNEHTDKMVEVKHIVFMHADRNVFRVQVVDCNWDETVGLCWRSSGAQQRKLQPSLSRTQTVLVCSPLPL